eukprot:s621_g14.t1
MEPEAQEELWPGPSWLPQRWDPECPVHQHLMEAAKCLRETGRFKDAWPPESSTVAYQKHLKDLNRPHLGFSATFPLFFASLRSGCDVSATSCGRAQLVRCEDHITDAFACCRSLLESLASDFGTETRQCPSDSLAKQKFVHELCTQAGICLDMVTGPTLDSMSNAPSTPASSHLEATPRTPATPAAGSAEFQKLMFGFMRAGSLLRSVQAEMDELHEEAQRYAADLKQGKVEEGKDVLHGVAQDGTIDQQLLQTFGSFLDLQLLPLYVRDVPPESLGETLLHYCGISLDEEDEIKARQVLGCPPRQKNQKKHLGKQISDASMPATPSSQGSAMEPSLRQIIQAPARHVDRRGPHTATHAFSEDLKLPRDVATPALARKRKDAIDAPSTPERKKKRLSAATVGPTPRVSRALLMSPELATPEPCLADDSPVRWKFAESTPVEPTSAETEVTACWSALRDAPW